MPPPAVSLGIRQHLLFSNRLRFFRVVCLADEKCSTGNEEAVGGGDERGQHAGNPAAITPRVDQPGRECWARGTPFFSLRYAAARGASTLLETQFRFGDKPVKV